MLSYGDFIMELSLRDERFLKSLADNTGLIRKQTPDVLREKLFDIKLTMLLWTREEKTKDLIRKELFHLYDNLSPEEINRLYCIENLRILSLMILVWMFSSTNNSV